MISLAIVNADPSGAPATVTELLATGQFSSVTAIDAESSTPSLSTLLNYDAVLAYTNYPPNDPTALGNVLADYADAGHRVTLATYGFSSPWAIAGRITDPGYSPLVNVGVNGNVSGNLVAVNPADPLFAGVNLANVNYFHNSNFSHPGLDSGATLLATDGAGIDMIARNNAGNIVGVNLFPAGGSNSEFYHLIANTLTTSAAPQATPEPSSLALLGMGGVSFAGCVWRRRRKQVVAA